MDPASATKRWVEHWQRVGPLLEKVRHDELRQLTDEQAANTFQSLADFAANVVQRSPRASSGFVEQQRLFLRLRQT